MTLLAVGIECTAKLLLTIDPRLVNFGLNPLCKPLSNQ